jgi:hypothetical protein
LGNVGSGFDGSISYNLQSECVHACFVDYYSKWVELFALRQATARTVSNILTKEILTRWGVPDHILSDRGSQFASDLFEETCQKMEPETEIEHGLSPTDQPHERVNQTLKTMVASYVGTHHKHWDKHLHNF